MAMFGWRSLAEAEIYTAAAERKKMAAMGMEFLEKGVARAASVPLQKQRKQVGQKVVKMLINQIQKKSLALPTGVEPVFSD